MNASTGNQLQMFDEHTKAVNSVDVFRYGNHVHCKFMPDIDYPLQLDSAHTHIASGSSDNTVRVFHLETGESMVLADHTKPVVLFMLTFCCVDRDKVFCVRFSKDGKYLASGSRDKSVLVYAARTGLATIPSATTANHRTILFPNPSPP